MKISRKCSQIFKTLINADLSQGFFLMETKEKHKIYTDFLFNRDIQDIQDKDIVSCLSFVSCSSCKKSCPSCLSLLILFFLILIQQICFICVNLRSYIFASICENTFVPSHHRQECLCYKSFSFFRSSWGGGSK